MAYPAIPSGPRELIENRISFGGPNSELSIYSTYEPACRVALRSPRLLYCGMLSGRKIMHGATPQPRTFLPGESFVMPPGRAVYIDFPEARHSAPTTCMTVEIHSERITDICKRLNDRAGDDDDPVPWQGSDHALHLHHAPSTQQLLQRLMTLFQEKQSDRDTLIDFALGELTVRMLRSQMRQLILTVAQSGMPSHGLPAAVQWLDQHIAQPVDINVLAEIAHASRATLYRQFRTKLGTTPCEYQQQRRIERARACLTETDIPITEICFSLGYKSLSHFIHRFKNATGLSPMDYRGSSDNV